MAIKEILTFPNPTLRKKSQPAKSVTDEIKSLAQDMLETMYKARGIGLAAPQIGELVRLVVIDTQSPSRSNLSELDAPSQKRGASLSKLSLEPEHGDGDGEDDEDDEDDDSDRYTMTPLEERIPQPLILINPEIVEKSGTTKMDEGCLSVPTYYETVTRSRHIRVSALNEDGEQIELETDGLLAICIQHEIDHLDGKLFIDRLSTLKSEKIKAKIKKYGYSTSSKEKESEEPPL